MQATQPQAIKAYFDMKRGRVVIELSSKLIVSFAPKNAEGLEQARPADLKEMRSRRVGLVYTSLPCTFLPCWRSPKFATVDGGSHGGRPTEVLRASRNERPHAQNGKLGEDRRSKW